MPLNQPKKSSLALRLLTVIAILALLPVAGALLNLAGIRAVQNNFDQVTRTTINFGEQHVKFRSGVRLLSLHYAEAGNFETAEGLLRTREVTASGLDTMRQSLMQLATTDGSEEVGELLITQREIEQAAEIALHTATTRLAQRERLQQLEANSPAWSSLQQSLTSLDQQLVDEHIGMRLKVQSMLETLAEIDRANFSRTSYWMNEANRALDRSGYRLLAIAAGSTLIALLVMYLLVQRNVVQRLRTLTDAIAAQIDGDLDRPVPIEGNDELTTMGEALEAARCNALALRASEMSLAERSAELERMNAELDNFAYVASHDLKAPMRALYSISSFLEEDIGADASGETRRHIAMLKDRSQRLANLLDALLEYSRVGRERTLPENVDIRRMLTGCADLVAPQHSNVQLSGNFGRVQTWRTPLEQIMRNLIDNAFKHNDRPPGSVTVDCDVQDDCLLLAVSDDGPGIAPDQHARVFRMFHRLKPLDDSDVGGSGMGLAVLKKLVDSYGGEVSIESDPAIARGTRVVLRWPHQGIVPVSG